MVTGMSCARYGVTFYLLFDTKITKNMNFQEWIFRNILFAVALQTDLLMTIFRDVDGMSFHVGIMMK